MYCKPFITFQLYIRYCVNFRFNEKSFVSTGKQLKVFVCYIYYYYYFFLNLKISTYILTHVYKHTRSRVAAAILRFWFKQIFHELYYIVKFNCGINYFKLVNLKLKIKNRSAIYVPFVFLYTSKIDFYPS